MDAILDVLDPVLFDGLYQSLTPKAGIALGSLSTNGTTSGTAFESEFDALSRGLSAWPRDNVYRQSCSILLIAAVGAASLYFIFASLSYFLLFDRRLEHHPRFLKNQVRQEIRSSLWAIPFIDIMTLPFFLGEVRGMSLLYSSPTEYGWAWLAISTILYLVWNDFTIYWIHRLEHHPSVYKYIHKPHHKWISKPTPHPYNHHD